MPAESKKPWFAVKHLGYGVGLPIAREGWLLLFLYLAVAVISALLLPPIASAVALIISTGATLFICYVKSDDVWRWRGE